MASTTTNRRQGLNTGAAVKVACKAATTANITLSGEQTIDGIACTDGDRVFVRTQTTASQNGIYEVSTSTWQRAKDFDGTFDVVEGTLIPVSRGSTYGGQVFRVTNTGTITIGTTSLTFELALDSSTMSYTPATGALAGIATTVKAFLDKLGDAGTALGAALIGFIQSGSGAISQTVQDVLRQMAVNAKGYGCTGDGSTDDTAALVKAIEAANGGWVFLPPGIYRITSKLDSLTSEEIRLIGPGDAWHADLLTPAVGDGRAWIKCDGVGLVGSYVKATHTMTFTDQLKGLVGISMYGVNSAPFAALTLGYELTPYGCHFQQFVRHGIWSTGASTQGFKRCSFWDIGTTVNCYNVGSADSSGGTPSSPLFMDGCSIRVDCGCTSGVSNNEVDAARVVTNRTSTVQIDDVVIGFSSAPTTSFKGINILGAIGGCTWNGLVTYGGVWAGWSNIKINGGWIETYATNGFTTSDATPYSIVDWNSTIRGDFYRRQDARRLRTTAFATDSDFHGYEVADDPATKHINRINPAEIVLGQYDPDGSSTAIDPVVGLGSSSNPILYYNSTLNAVLGSKGNHFYPYISMPSFQSGDVDNSANVTTTQPAYTQWNIGGGSTHADGGVEYEVTIRVGTGSNGRLFHHSVWRMFLTQFHAVSYMLAETNPTAGITVTNSSGNINIANATGSDLQWSATFRLLGPCVFAPSN